MGDLAIFGGSPLFEEPKHVGRPNMGDREKFLQLIDSVLDRHIFTNDGPLVREFEDMIARETGTEHCIAMCNGTVALEIAIRALGLKGEVIVPSMTFIATAHALMWQGIQPVFCDVIPGEYTVDPESVERSITDRTTGVIGVHLWGRGCRVEELQELCMRRDISLIFDAAHAFGCSIGGTPIGSFGNAEVFSFHATKFINSFEGGAVVTNDSVLAEKLRLMRNFGFSGYDNVVYAGTNGKMMEVSAAMGITSIESKEKFLARNRENHAAYQELISEISGLSIVRHQDDQVNNNQYVVCLVKETNTNISRDMIQRILWKENIYSRRYFYPGCHRMPIYMTQNAYVDLPVTQDALNQVLVLPTGMSVDHGDIERTCGLLSFVVSNAKEINEKLGGV